MQGKSLARSLAAKSGFTVVAELAADPGFNFAPIEKFLRAYRQADAEGIPPEFDFVGVTVPQNPGGVANLEPADVLARIGGDLLGPLDFLPHVSCKDHNSDAIMSSLVGYRTRGITSVLALTGDKPVSSQGVFEIESVGLLKLLERMNNTAYLKAGPGTWDAVKQFFPGAAVSPFKYTEAAQMQQYYKMEKKIAAGARFLITQVGWDWRKSLELMRYLQDRQIDIPVLGNVYLLTSMTPAPRLMHGGKLPGCFVSDELYAKIQSETIDEHIERAAQQVAMYKAIGAAGVDVGGLLDFETFVAILQRAEEIDSQWEKHKDNLHWPGGDRFYLYDQTREQPVPTKRKSPMRRRSYNLVHRLVLDPDHAGFRLWRRFMSFAGARKGKGLAYTSFSAVERAVKYVTFDCQDCGDCYLPENFGYCTLGGCEKGLSNTPCGDSTVDGRCGNNLEKTCIGDRIYETAVSEPGGADRLRSTINRPRNPKLQHTSSVLNYLFEQDHTKKSPLISIADAIHASHPKTGKVMKEILDLGNGAFTGDTGPVGYIKALIRHQAGEGAHYIAVNVDDLSDAEGLLAEQMIKQYVRLIREYGDGVPVCLDSMFDDALVIGLKEWYGGHQPVRPPLLSPTRIETVSRVLPLKQEYDFNLVGPLGETSTGSVGAHEAAVQAKRLFDKAVVQYGFGAEQLFFNPVAVPLIKDEPTLPGGLGHTHGAFETIKKIASDSSLKRCHCLLRTSDVVAGLPGRAVGVCRAYVAKALDYGLDAAFVNVAHHYGESPADPQLLEMVSAYVEMDGTPGRKERAQEQMDRFCAGVRKPRRKAPVPAPPISNVIPLASGASGPTRRASHRVDRRTPERTG